jgi:leucyl/phenylalanyl-tRNA--protein transferase
MPAIFPDPRHAPGDEPLAWGHDLTPALVKAAYRAGIFPWYNDDSPVLWWSPDPRCVLYPEKFKVSDSFRKTLRNPKWSVSCDTDFGAVIRACAASPRPGQDGTWITEKIISAYSTLHREGVVHSVEVRVDGELIGGLYGVAVGRVFCGESMFFKTPDASKIALAHLVARLREAGFALIDCQQVTPHLLSLGAEAVSRDTFLDVLEANRDLAPVRNPWE